MRDTSRTFEMVETSRFRARVTDLIELMVDLLDSLDPDPDLEDAGDDDVSWPENMSQSRLSPRRGMTSEDDEPSLGSTERRMPVSMFWTCEYVAWGTLGHKGPSGAELKRDDGGSQLRWCEGAREDAEGDEHDGSEPDVDAENDPAESGIADQEALDLIQQESEAPRAFEREEDRSRQERMAVYYGAQRLAQRKGRRLRGEQRVRFW